jgi:hypothetical protein
MHERSGFATRGRRIFAYTLLVCVMGCVAAMSWSGLYSFATHELGWSGWHAAMFPASLDVAAMTCALLALDAIDQGETAVSLRGLTLAFVGLSAFINWRTALLTGQVTQEVFFPSMSVLAYLLVHQVMGSARRRIRREQFNQKSKARMEPLPRFGVLVWIPGLGVPRQAIAEWRYAIARRLANATAELHDSDGETQPEPDAIQATVSLEGLSQSDAIRRAIEAAGREVPGVVAYLESHGWPGVKPQRVHDVLRRDRERLTLIQGETGETHQVAPATPPETTRQEESS